MKTKKFNVDDWKGIAGTLLFHGLLLGLFLFSSFKTPIPPFPKEETMEFEMGGGGGGGGSEDVSALINTDQTEAVDDQTEDLTSTEKSSEPTSVKKVIHHEEKKVVIDQPVVNTMALYKKPNKNDGKGGGSGTGNGTGNGSGSGSGNGSGTGSGNGSGNGSGTGAGNGPSFSLNGRMAKYLQKPDNNFTEQGTVVVTIWVNQNGEVSRAEAGARGTTSTNSQLWKLATAAALKTKFTVKSDAPEEQKGSITYHFIRQN